MKQCTACDRHLFGEEPSCPFCGAEQRTTAATPTGSVGSMLASVTLALGLCAAACGPTIELEPAEDSSSSDTSPSLTTTTSTTTGVLPTTSGPMTADGSSTTAIGTSSSSSDAGDDFPCAFYACPPDVGEGPFECDPFVQDCPPGEKCMPWADDGGSWNATRCSPIAGDPAQDGEPCTVEGSATSGIDDCDQGLMCFYVALDTGQGTCVSMCQGTVEDPVCRTEDRVCSITNDGALTLCLESCDPLMQTCPEGQGCYPVYDDFVCSTAITETVYGDPCDYINGCSPGQLCVGSGTLPSCMQACCTEYCDLSAPEACPEAMLGATCQPWYEAGSAPPGLEDVGACALPS